MNTSYYLYLVLSLHFISVSIKKCESSSTMAKKLERVLYEEALDMTGWGRFNFVMFTMCCGIVAAMVFELYSVSYVVPASACELNTTSEQQGLMAGLPLAGVIATSHLWGYLADKHGRRKILCFTMIIGYITGSLAAFSPNWIVLCVLKFFSSAAVSGGAPLAITLLGECSPNKQRSAILLQTTTVFLICTGVMAVISMPVLPLKFSYYIPLLDIQFNSWRLLNLIFSSPCAFAAVGAIFSSESPKYLLSVGQSEKTMIMLRKMYAKNNGKPEAEFQVNSVILGEDTAALTDQSFFTSIVSQTIPLFKFPLLRGTLKLSVLFVIVFFCANPFIVWLPVILDALMSSVDKGATGLSICDMIRLSRNTTANVDEIQDCSMNNTGMSVVLCISMLLALMNVISGLMLNIIGKRRLYIGIQILSGLAAICINFSPMWILSAILLFILLLEVMNFGFLSSFTVDLFPTYVKATAVCLMLMLGRGVTILGINVLRSLLEYNCEAAFYMFASLTIAAGLIGFLLPADKPFFKPLEESNEAP